MEKPRVQSALLALAGILLCGAGIAGAGVTPAQKCEAAKLGTAGKGELCYFKIIAKATKTGSNTLDFTKCDAAFAAKWSQAETNGNGQCPTNGDAMATQSRIAFDAGSLGVLLSGGSVPVCGNGVIEGGESCDFNNLNGQTCQSLGFVAGQLSCTTGTCVFNTSGCFATRFVDNGDGTVTDHLTGLMWEQKDNLDSVQNLADPHDADNTYNWCSGMYPNCTNSGGPPDGTAYTDFLAKLNNSMSPNGGAMTPITGCFAGRCDWRLPTIVELQTIVDCSGGAPCVDPIFGPTQDFAYWSATTVSTDQGGAWAVVFSFGGTIANTKFDPFALRAVRGGL